MTTSAALRPMLAVDGAALAAIYRDSIAALTAEDYNDEQREAWAGRADDEAWFGQRLLAQLTLVATLDASAVGFASLKGSDHIDMLFVDPDHARTGVATLLVEALVRLAGARGVAKLTVDASDAAREFFAARGFTATMRKTVPIGDQWLGNTAMERTLAPSA